MVVTIPAEAAHVTTSPRSTAKVVQEKVAETAVKDVEATGSIQTDEDTGYCSKARRRLFVEGEGWIVRKVTTCY